MVDAGKDDDAVLSFCTATDVFPLLDCVLGLDLGLETVLGTGLWPGLVLEARLGSGLGLVLVLGLVPVLVPGPGLVSTSWHACCTSS